MKTDQEIEQAIVDKGLTVAPRVTVEEIDKAMSRVKFVVDHRPGGTTSTFVHAYPDGVFYLASGHSACVSSANYNAEIGERIAKGKAESEARNKLWELFGFRLYAKQAVLH